MLSGKIVEKIAFTSIFYYQNSRQNVCNQEWERRAIKCQVITNFLLSRIPLKKVSLLIHISIAFSLLNKWYLLCSNLFSHLY